MRDCETALTHLAPFFEHVHVFPELESRVREIIRKHPKQVEQKMLIEGHSAQQVALQLIGGIAYGECESGKHHTYRGILSMNGTAYKQAVAVTHDRLIAIGALDATEAADIRQELAQAIKDAG